MVVVTFNLLAVTLVAVQAVQAVALPLIIALALALLAKETLVL
jgi:hypothetical protein